MPNCIRLAMLLGLLNIFALPPALWAEEMDTEAEREYRKDPEKYAESTALISVEGEVTAEAAQRFSIEYLLDAEVEVVPIEILGAFLVHLPPDEVRARLRARELEGKTVEPKVKAVDQNALVHGFSSGCQNEQDLPTDEQGQLMQVTPDGIRRVQGPVPWQQGQRVWIIDSGIAGVYDPGNLDELNVNRSLSVECTPGTCIPRSNAGANDTVGHGTMIAGIVGAKDNDLGVVGVAPGVELVAVQIFYNHRITTIAIAAQALAHVKDHASPGDVVNISWGFKWTPGNIALRTLEDEIINLAKDSESDLSIAVAAGNSDTIEGPGYVQLISPARLGGDEPQIVTISAADSIWNESTSNWTDSFWPHSAYGNGETANGHYKGPPNFAEPGVNVLSLWPGPSGKLNTCNGTSFAAPHAAGIMLAKLPQPDGRAVGDMSADHPVLGQDPAREDRIGVYTP